MLKRPIMSEISSMVGGDSGSQDVWASLEGSGVDKWLRGQVEAHRRSTFYSGITKNPGFNKGFFQGKVYGYVLAKTGSQDIASRAGTLAVEELERKEA